MVLVIAAAGCSASVVRGTAQPPSAMTAPAVPSTPAAATSASPSPRPDTSHARSSSTPAPSKTTRAHPSTPQAPSTAPPPPRTAPLIVLDPGHSVTVHATDPATGLDVSDYENEPEMTDVYAVARLVRTQLLAAGYRVLMTKPSLDAPTSLGRRAQIANDAHAALAVSIHDQAGTSGGIPFASGNNVVYYQAVGDYRTTPAGHKVVFTNAAVAAASRRYGAAFQAARAAHEGHAVALQGSTGYDLASRGLQAGDIWIVQLLSTVPWIYCEAGGNSAGRSGLDSTDEARYAAGLVAGVEHSVPVTR